MTKGASQDTQFLLAAYPKSSTTKEDRGKETWGPVLQALAQSFGYCFEGKWPPGTPLAGTQLVPGDYRLVVWSLLGDHEYFSNVLGLAHWRNASLCWCCNAQQNNWKVSAPELREWRCKTAEEIRADQPEHAFFTIPGVSSMMVAHDLLHALFCKGVLSHLMGGAMHVWLWPTRSHRRPAGETAASALGVIFSRVQELYKDHKSTTRLTNLRLSMFMDEAKHWKSEPVLKIKGSEAKPLLPCLTTYSKEINKGSDHDERLVAAFESIFNFVKLIDESGDFLTTGEADLALELCLAFLDHSEGLEEWALQADRLEYHRVPKYHMLLHLAEQARYLNPKLQWCFKSEDFVGKMATLGHSVSMSVASHRLSMKLCAKYRVFLHLRFTRDDCFDNE